MRKTTRIIQILFAVPWLVFGLQHFMFVDFVAGLVPAYFPLKSFWAYFTGTAMIAAGISFIVNKKSRLAAALLGVMLAAFILLIHTSTLANNPAVAINWTRALQDLAIASAAFMLAGVLTKRETENDLLIKSAKISRYVLALLLIVFGGQQFFNLDFLTARVPDYLPLRLLWVYLTGALMIVAGVSVIVNKKAALATISLGVVLFIINLLNHAYLLANNLHVALLWTGAMLDLALTCGIFILADTLTADSLTDAAHSIDINPNQLNNKKT